MLTYGLKFHLMQTRLRSNSGIPPIALVIHCPPKVVQRAADLRKNFFRLPRRATRLLPHDLSLSDLGGALRSEPMRLKPDILLADIKLCSSSKPSTFRSQSGNEMYAIPPGRNFCGLVSVYSVGLRLRCCDATQLLCPS